MRRGNIAKFCCFCFALFVSAGTFAQGKKVTLDLDKVPLPAALRQVEQQSEYYKINYPYEEVNRYTVSLNVKDVPAPEAVEALLRELPLAMKVNGRFITISRKAAKAEKGEGGGRRDRRAFSGHIVDADGEPLAGVAIQVKGTNLGTVTDNDGNYTLTDIDPNNVLVISYIGKKKLEIKAGNRKSVIILEDEAYVYDDVVVTGYQTISKERATGSFAKVTTDDLKAKRFDNISQLLEGEVAGFNTKSNLIRGISTMNGVATPLYVIDGFPVENTRYNDYGGLEEYVPNINIDDIESITVLKDAAAASIYGARAANGVVVIVTKKAAGKKTNVSFSTSLTYHPYSYYKDRLTDAADMVDLEREWAGSNPNLMGDGAADYARSLLDNNVYPSQGIRTIANYYAGNLSQSDMESTLANLAAQGYRYYDDVKKHAKRDAFYQRYHLNVGRASDHNNFTASLTYTNNRMNDRFTNDNAWGVDIKDILDLNSWLTFEFGSYNYYKKAQEQTYDALSPGYSYMPYDGLKNDDGTNYTKPASERLSVYDMQTLENYGLYSMDITPLDETGRNLRHTNSFTNRTYGKLNADILPGLKYNVMFQYEYSYDKAKLLYDKNSYYVRNLVNQYATDDYYTGEVTYNVPYGNIYYRVNQTVKNYTFRQQLNFDKTFGEKHNVVALAGHEVRKSVTEYDNSTLYNYDPDMLSFSLVDQNVLNNTYGLMGGYGLYARDFASNRYVDNRYISFYGNAAYTYDERYMASASIRWDRSNLWGTSSKYQNKPIWSFGLGWNIDREKWFDVSFIDRLKLRLSHGISGNVSHNSAPYMTAYYNESYTVGGRYGYITTPPNPTLRWEKTTTTNLALDFSLFNNRIDGSIEYYNRKGTDLLASTMGVPTEGFGYSTYTINNGEMYNRGVELTLSGAILRGRDISLNATLMYSYNKNKVEHVEVEAPFYILQLDYPEAYPRVGNPFNAIYGYRWAGLSSEGLPQIYDGEGNVVNYVPGDLESIHYFGTTEPTRLASLNLSFRYKRFDLSCLWVYQGGHKMRNTDLPVLPNAYNPANWSYVASPQPVNKHIADRWREPGDEAKTNVPRAVFGESDLFSSDSYSLYQYADINVLDASNLRLANVSLAYNLPAQWLRPLRLGSARVQFNMENVCTFAKSSAAKYLLDGYAAPNYVLSLHLDF